MALPDQIIARDAKKKMNVTETLTKLLELSGGARLSRYLNRNRPIILMYHRVLSDPMLPGINPNVFAKQLKYLSEHFRVVSMSRLVDELKSNTVKPYTVAITFDDGHQDFYTNAWPALRHYHLPASLYIATGFIDNQCWLWPDLLRYELMNANVLSIDVDGIGTLPLERENILETWNTLGDYCLKLSPFDRKEFLNSLGEKLGVTSTQEPLPPFNPLTWDQLREMQVQGLDVGSHTVSHAILSALSNSDLIEELEDSYNRIFQELKSPPTGICYPNGMAEDVSRTVESVAGDLYSYGLVAYPDQVERSRIMHLGRWAASSDFTRFKRVMNSISRNDNHSGEYR